MPVRASVGTTASSGTHVARSGVGLVRVHGVQEHDAADLGRIAVGVAQDERAAERVSGHDVRRGHVRALEQDVQVARCIRVGGDVAATVAGAVVHAYACRAGDLWGDPSCDGRRGLAESGLEHDCRASRADAADVEPMSADVDESVAGDGCRCAAGAGLHGLVAAADGRERHHSEHGIEQPRTPAARGLAPGLSGHPEHEAQQQRRPDPSERVERLRVRGEDDESGGAEAQHRGRYGRPAVRPVAEARGEHRQECPSDREAEQDRAGDRGLAAVGERHCDERDGGGDASEQGARDDFRRGPLGGVVRVIGHDAPSGWRRAGRVAAWGGRSPRRGSRRGRRDWTARRDR